MNYFQNLLSVRCETETKGKLLYVSWIEAWTRLKAEHPGATYKVHQTPDGSFLHGEGLVMVSVSVPDALGDPVEDDAGVTHTMWLPVMDMKNAQIKQPTSTDVNKALMRCLAKCVAMHGLGSYVYMGEDLPVIAAEAPAPPAVDYAANLRDLPKWLAGTPTIAQLEAMQRKVGAWPSPFAEQAREMMDAAFEPIVS